MRPSDYCSTPADMNMWISYFFMVSISVENFHKFYLTFEFTFTLQNCDI